MSHFLAAIAAVMLLVVAEMILLDLLGQSHASPIGKNAERSGIAATISAALAGPLS